VLELFEVRPRTAGYMDGRIRACYPALPPMVGFASTATFRAAAPPRGGDTYMGLGDQVARLAANPLPKVVVFQDLDDPPVAATFGEIMATTYKAFGCVGLITSGAGRDLDQVEPLRFPCFTSGTIPSHGYTQIVELEVPVRVGGVWVTPGDLLHGDRNGVTTIPLELAELVVEGCEGFMAAEAVVLNYLRGGNVTAAGYVPARDECKRQMAELGKRLRAKLR
jgi:regulator of RNase E activity RraA